jgi:hypothetical protein
MKITPALKAIQIIICLSILIMSVGCATVISGKNQLIKINSKPDDATVLITSTCAPGTYMSVTTPTEVKLSRSEMYHLTFSKEGYKPIRVGIGHKANSYTFLDLIGIIVHAAEGEASGLAVFGGISILIDHLTGAIWKLTPTEINIELQPESK